MNPTNPANPMQIGSEEWKALLIQGAAQAGLSINARQAGLMAEHALVLADWNRKINLTAITDPIHMAVKHFLDAVLPMPHIPAEVQLLDMGTGAGFPGIPLKIMRPAQPMTLMDGSRKKINFVKHVLRLLKVPNISAIHVRAEALARDPLYQGRFHVIVCRAFADLHVIARLAAPLLSAAGSVYVYQGPGDKSRQVMTVEAQSPSQYRLVASYAYALPILGDRRTLTVMKPIDD
ncbi:MAG: 16S rRNA (guanine(527)-N(7))-methyltransferase RsmG [Desulfobacteraceae bacterium]|nr:MAG: 16S rRNA (guanine(527)-N(7))-methyltransferase RsmG [Desulfobacteraceae bacterium]